MHENEDTVVLTPEEKEKILKDQPDNNQQENDEKEEDQGISHGE
jgi:hypothetical protein